MADQRVTIAVIPGERFSLVPQSLASLLAESPGNELIYIDGGSPPRVRQYLEQRAARHGFRLISTERYVSPNVARNLALAEVRTPLVVFVDSDVQVTPGWLEPLVDCAAQSGAWIVGAAGHHQQNGVRRIATAAGSSTITERAGRRTLDLLDAWRDRPLAELQQARAEPVGFVSLATALVDVAAARRLGPLDEDLLCGVEHLDLGLRVQQAGGKIYFQPQSLVELAPAASLEAEDLEYFQLRWCDAWNRHSLDHFGRTWNLPADDPALRAIARHVAEHRRVTIEPYRRVLRLLGEPAARWVERVLIAPLEQAASRRRHPSANASLSAETRLPRAA